MLVQALKQNHASLKTNAEVEFYDTKTDNNSQGRCT